MRVLSHYKNLMDYRIQKIDHPCMKIEGQWLGKNLSDFIDNIPDDHLLNQLYMFSRNLDIDEALHSLSRVSCIMFTEHFAEGIDYVNRGLGMQLTARHLRKSSYSPEVSEDDLSQLKARLSKEYALLDRIKSEQGGALNVALPRE